MKITVEISPALLLEAKALAREQQTTLKSLLEEGIRLALDRRRRRVKPFQLRMPVAHLGRPLISDWASVREFIYEGRGGMAAVSARRSRNRSQRLP